MGRHEEFVTRKSRTVHNSVNRRNIMGKPQRKAWKQQNPSPSPASVPVSPVAPPTAKPRTEHEAGLEKIREAINLISTHSGAAIGGSMLSEALTLLESGYATLKPK
jgi:hypothetical protein